MSKANCFGGGTGGFPPFETPRMQLDATFPVNKWTTVLDWHGETTVFAGFRAQITRLDADGNLSGDGEVQWRRLDGEGNIVGEGIARGIAEVLLVPGDTDVRILLLATEEVQVGVQRITQMTPPA